MDWHYSSLIFILSLNTAMALALVLYAWRRRRSPGAMPFVVLMLAIAVWASAYGFELSSASVSAQILWLKIRYLGIVTLPAAWLVFTLEYTGRDRQSNRRILTLLTIAPAITLFLIWTNERHHLFWKNIEQRSVGPFHLLEQANGIAFWINLSYTYFLIVIGALIILRAIAQGSTPYRARTSAVLIGLAAPLLGSLLSLTYFSSPPQLSLTPFAFAFTGVISLWGVVRFRFLEIVPLAHQAIIAGMSDGLVVLDTKDRIVYTNQAACQILGRPTSELSGKPADQVLSSWPDLIHPDLPTDRISQSDTRTTRKEVTLGAGREQRHYELQLSPLDDPSGFHSGRLIIWHDISERNEAEQALRRQLEEMTVLHAVASACADANDEDLLIERLTEIIGDTFYPDNFGVILVNAPSGELHTHPSYREKMDIQHTPHPLGSGVTGRVALEGRSRRVEDVSQEPAYVEVDPNTRSELCVPLKIGQRVIGVINTESDQLGAFSQADERLLTILADQIAIAIERLRVEAAERQRVQELLAITRVSREITSVLDRQQVLDSIVRHATEISEAGASGLFAYRPDGRLQLVAAYGVGEEFIQAINAQGVSLEGNAVGQAITTRQPFQIPDIREDVTYSTHQIAEMENIRAILALPMQRGDEVTGGIVIWDRQPRFFSQEEKRFLQALANQSVNAVENARLFDETQRRLHEITLLSEIISLTASAVDLPSALSQVCRKVACFLNGKQAAFARFDPDSDEAEVIAEYLGEDHPSALGIKIPTANNPGWDCLLEHKKPLAIREAQNDPLLAPLHEILRQRDTVSALFVPLLQGERITGILVIGTTEQREFTQPEMQLMHDIGIQVSQALERLHLFTAAKEQAQKVQQIVDTVPEGVLLLDANQKIVLANPVAQQYLSVLLSQADADQPVSRLGNQPIDLLLEAPSTKPWHETQTDSTPKRTFEIAAQPLVVEAQSGGWVLVLRDVTQEREEQAYIQVQERLATVGQLAAGIAHDFNNMMAAVVVYTDLLATDPNLTPSSQEQLSIIQQQVQRATSLIKQILDFSRRAVMEQINLDLLPFIKELDKLLMRVLPENIQLDFTYEPGVYQVKADPTRLQQALMNLALNARDAMPTGGILQFILERVTLASEDELPSADLSPGDWIRLVIRDTGSGIPAEILPHVFDPFFTTKPVGQGTGLGLAQAYGIIKQHGGSIDVQSVTGEGTMFVIHLPELKTPSEQPSVAEISLRMSGAGETVLVVEDDRAARDALQSLLESQDFRVLCAKNGVEALQIFEQEQDSIILVVSDVVMPEMGGVALYQAMRKIQPLIKVLFLTGHPLDIKNHVLLEMGRVHRLQKPFSVKEFVATLRTMLHDVS